jgi:hypothetical protein
MSLCGTARYFIKTSYDSFDSQELYALRPQGWLRIKKKILFFSTITHYAHRLQKYSIISTINNKAGDFKWGKFW